MFNDDIKTLDDSFIKLENIFLSKSYKLNLKNLKLIAIDHATLQKNTVFAKDICNANLIDDANAVYQYSYVMRAVITHQRR